MDVWENAARGWQQAECPHCGDDAPAKVGEESGENGGNMGKWWKNWGKRGIKLRKKLDKIEDKVG